MSAPEQPGSRTSSGGGMTRRGLRVTWLALRSAPKPFTVGIVGASLFAAMTVAAAQALGWVTDEILLPTLAAGEVTASTLTLAVVLIVGIALLKAAGVVGRRLGAFVAQQALQATYRRKVTRRYLELPLLWHRRHPTGELLSNANADVESAFFVAAPLPMAVGTSVLLAVTAALLISTDPALAAIGFSIGPVLGFANWYYQRAMQGAASVAQQARAEVTDVAHESFDSALVVKTLGREAQETDRFRTSAEDLRDKLIVVGRLRAFFDPVIEALPNVGVLLVLLVGAIRVRDGNISVGDLVLFAYLFRLIALPMRVVGWFLGELPRAVVGWERVARVLRATGKTEYGTTSVAGRGGADAEMDEVTFHHPAPERSSLEHDAPATSPVARHGDGEVSEHDLGARGVTDVSFDVEAGRVIAVVGATGSGKSTVASLLVRLFDPDRGVVTFDGTDVRALARDELAEHLAIVPQEAFLFDDTVRGNITLGQERSDAEVVAAARLARAHDFITALEHGYDTPVGERGASLSGGQRQRIALARALVRRPRLLVLDDATSAVDPSVESDILRGLAGTDLDATVIVVAYRRASIALADEVVFIRHGTVAARGTHDDLLRDVPAYRDLVTAYDHRPDVATGANAADRADHVAGASDAGGGHR